MKNKPLLISFSGGRTSAFMLKMILENNYLPQHEKIVVFANTGKEKEQTLDFVNKCDKEFKASVVWLEAAVNPLKGKATEFNIVDFKTANRAGAPFADSIKKYGLPSMSHPFCTRELKQQPILTYMKSRGFKDWFTALGIRADETKRAKYKSTQRLKSPVYPLIEWGINEEFIRGYWKQAPFDLRLKDYQGNCDLCYKKSKRKKLTLLAEEPALANWWAEMEKQHGKGKYIFNDRHHVTIEQLLELSKNPFTKSIDKEERREKEAPSLFKYDMDIDYDCLCKS